MLRRRRRRRTSLAGLAGREVGGVGEGAKSGSVKCPKQINTAGQKPRMLSGRPRLCPSVGPSVAFDTNSPVAAVAAGKGNERGHLLRRSLSHSTPVPGRGRGPVAHLCPLLCRLSIEDAAASSQPQPPSPAARPPAAGDKQEFGMNALLKGERRSIARSLAGSGGQQRKKVTRAAWPAGLLAQRRMKT